MSEAITFEYRPNPAETAAGTRLAARPVYSGIWRAATIVHDLLIGLCIATGAFTAAFFAMRLAGVQDEMDGAGFYVIFAAVALGIMALAHVIRRRPATTCARAAKTAEMTAHIDATGIKMTGPRSHSFHDWRDIEAIIEGRRVIVAAFGNQGWIFSDRMLGSADDPAEIRLQIIAWHSAANDEAAS